MFLHPTIHSLLTLLTAAMISLQSFGMGLTVCCDASASDCRRPVAASKSCCSSTDRSCCSAPTVRCCCRSNQTQCRTACSCGNHKPQPAMPCQSRPGEDSRQLLMHAVCHRAMASVSTMNCQPRVVQSWPLPAPRAGVNVLHCVWLT